MRRRGHEAQEKEYGFRPEADSDEFEAATSRYGDPPTVTAPRGRANVVSIDFDDETCGRIDVDATPPRTAPFGAHPDPRADVHEDREPASRGRGLDVAYEDLPSLEMRRPFDSYDAEVAERDAAAQLRAARESMRRFQSAHPVKPHDLPPAQEAREASGPRQRPQEYAASVPSYDEDPSWDEPAIPAAPPVPREAQVPQNFVMGVQALRTPQAFPPPAQPYPAPPGYAMSPAQMQHAQMQHAQMQHAHMQHAHMQQMQAAQMQAAQMRAQTHGSVVAQMPVAPGTQAMAPMPHAYPQAQAAQSLQLPAQAPAPPRTGRFAWFFFGAVFGVCFAFFATGYFSPGGSAKKDDAFPPAPPPPVTVPVGTIAATPVVTVSALPPPVVIAPPPPVVIAPPPSASAPPVFTPPPPPTYASPSAPAPVVHATAPSTVPSTAKVASAPPTPPAPRAQRVVARRPSPQGEDDAPAPAAKRPSAADTGNLLSDALSP